MKLAVAHPNSGFFVYHSLLGCWLLRRKITGVVWSGEKPLHRDMVREPTKNSTYIWC